MRNQGADVHLGHDLSDGSRRPAGLSTGLVPYLTLFLLILSLTSFAIATPGPLLRKADMVGYAVCHQIESHSFSLATRQLPLCARCTGTFLGALTGLVAQALVLRRRRAAAFPPTPILAVLIFFTFLWMADGVNSYLALIRAPHLYEPQNTLRLITGALNGVTMSALVYPILNVSLWRSPADRPAFRTLYDVTIVLLLETVLILLILSGWDALLYPVALLSAAGVLALLASVNTVIAVIILRRENSVDSWRQALVPLSIGLILAFIQIGLIDLARYALTGTLRGMPPFQ